MRALKGSLAPLPVVCVVGAVLITTAGLTSGIWVWPRAWLFIATYALLAACCSAMLAVFRPLSLSARRQPVIAAAERRQPWVDAAGVLIYAAFALAWFAFVAVDVFRLQFFQRPPTWLSDLGLGLALAGQSVAYLAIAQNRFATPAIQDQTAEDQQVIQTGLYALVRHPFYAGMLLVYVGAALWLGSYAAAIGSLGFLVMTLARIVIEERFLRANLPAYASYSRRVRAKLIPFLL